MHPVDFTEEVAIGYGYFNIPKTIREGCVGEYHPIQSFSNKIRLIMIGAGYLEVLNFILSNSEKQFDYMKKKMDESKLIQIANPVSKEYDTMRIRIFEVGDIILLSKEEETGAKREIHLSATSYHEDADFTEIRSTLDFIMTALGLYDKYEIKPGKNPSYISGRYGDIYVNGEKIGEIGEIHPEVLLNFKLEFPVAGLELNLQKLL
jgi:phenylalanyl-tRNA synthetase beta chain